MKLRALVLAGGKGTRMNHPQEKPLIEVGRLPMIYHVVNALEQAETIQEIVIATSKHTPKTKQVVEDAAYHVLDTPGDGYHADLRYAVKKLEVRKLLTIVADLLLVTPHQIDRIVDFSHHCGKSALMVVTPVEPYEQLAFTPKTTFSVNGQMVTPLGINIIDGTKIDDPAMDQAIFVLDPAAVPLNVNSVAELEVAERLFRQRLTTQVKHMAKVLGADLLGICPRDCVPPDSRKGAVIRNNRSNDVCIVSAFSFQKLFGGNPEAEWSSPLLKTWEKKSRKLVEFLTRHGYFAELIRSVGRPANKLERTEYSFRDLAICAGLGCLGKNQMVITPQYGPRVFISIVTTNAPLAIDPPFIGDLCADCRLCVDACPFEALTETGIDRSKCSPQRCRHNTRHTVPCLAACPLPRETEILKQLP